MRILIFVTLLGFIFGGCIQKSQPNNLSRKQVAGAPLGSLGITHKIIVTDYKDIQVNEVKLGDDVKKLKYIGKVDSIVAAKSDFDSPSLKRYYFHRSYFEVTGDSLLYGFSVKDSTLVLKNFNVKIGDRFTKVVNRITSKFISSKNNLEIGNNTIKLRIAKTDSYLMFTFKNGSLNEYETWEDL